MKRIAIGDLHLEAFEEDTLDNDNLPMRLGYIKKSLEYIMKFAEEKDITNFDFLGDIIDGKNIISNIAQNMFKEFLSKYKKYNFVMISGNHDISHTGPLQKSAISVFSEYLNVTCVADKPLVIDNRTYIPYCNNMMDTLKSIKDNDILIGHFGISEAMLQSGLSRIDKIKMNDVGKKFKLSILGHYHKPQHIENNDIHIYYPGSLIPRNWNDKNETKQFCIYDTESFEVESIPIENQIQYKEYIIDNISIAKEILVQAEKDKNAGHHVRIRKNIKEDIETPHDIMILEHKDVDITNRGINVTQTLQEKLQKYMDIKEIKNEEHENYLKVLQKYDII